MLHVIRNTGSVYEHIENGAAWRSKKSSSRRSSFTLKWDTREICGAILFLNILKRALLRIEQNRHFFFRNFLSPFDSKEKTATNPPSPKNLSKGKSCN